ncbi:TetR/AcrR family transcriptional regulator [Salinactinospora qingdaonensis]
MSPDTGSRTSYHHGALRQTLVDSARELLIERGDAGFSLNELARRIGVSTAAPYRHFEDREALLLAVAEEAYEELRVALDAASRTTDDPAERILRMGAAYVRFAADNASVFSIMFRGRAAREHSFDPAAFQSLVEAVTVAQHSGDLRSEASARMLSRSIWATVHGLATLHLSGGFVRVGMDDTPERLASETLATFLRDRDGR